MSRPNAPTESETTPAPTGRRSGWDVLIIAVALTALIVLTIYTARHYGGNATNAATILGIVVPAFATIGAAAFGITVAYSAGQAKGEATGQAKTAAEKEQAVATVRKETAEKLAPALASARDALREISGQLNRHAYSPPGETEMILGVRPRGEGIERGTIELEPQPVPLDPQPLREAQRSLDELGGFVAGLNPDFE
jgi:hypothetical protein